MVLKKIIKTTPQSPGVYLFKDKAKRIIYIGKSNNLKARIQAYQGHFLSTKTQAMLERIRAVDFLLTSSPAQAQLLEAALIKQHQPFYNISLRDDKSFPLLRISEEKFPSVSICRRKRQGQKQDAQYFGPYTNAKLLRQALAALRRIFTFRSCMNLPKKPCLYYRLKLCSAPCAAKITQRDYQKEIAHLIMFLEGRQQALLDELTLKMRLLARERRFEEAAQLRDQIQALLSLTGGASGFASKFDELKLLQKILHLQSLPRRIEAFDVSDIFGNQACAAMVSFYDGKKDANNYRRFRIKTVKQIDDYQMLEEALKRRYSRAKEEKLPLPHLIIIDGGRGHLNLAERVLAGLALKIPLMSIAKAQEKIYITPQGAALELTLDSPALRLVQRIRDEAHRFAIAYHRSLRRKQVFGQN